MILGYARVEAGRDVVQVEAVGLYDVVEESLVLVRPLADRKGLAIRVEGAAPPIELHTDARKLRQILVNLLANAITFTDTGDVLLVLRVEAMPDVCLTSSAPCPA